MDLYLGLKKTPCRHSCEVDEIVSCSMTLVSRVPPADPMLPGLNGGLNRELDRVVGDFGLSSQKMALLREKKEDIERVSSVAVSVVCA